MSTDFRFIGIAPSVDLTERRSKMINDQTEPFTLDEMRGYKVFTALLTQSGGDDTFGLNSGSLIVGVTYSIENVGRENFDFTNVGAPNNIPGTWFIATGTTPNSWGTGGNVDALLAFNTGAPVVTILENTIGNVWFSYNFDELWAIANCTNAFTSKTFWTITLPGATEVLYSGFVDSLNTFVFQNSSLQSFANTPIEIRIYN